MATIILRIVAACCCSFVSYLTRSSLVTPSTIRVSSGPKSDSSCWRPTAVSSTASCNRAAAMVMSSIP